MDLVLTCYLKSSFPHKWKAISASEISKWKSTLSLMSMSDSPVVFNHWIGSLTGWLGWTGGVGY